MLVSQLTEQYLRPMKDRISDIYGESEFERLMRQEYMDDASLFRLDSQIEGVDYRRSDNSFRRGALRAAGKTTEQAKEQTDKLKKLADEGTMIRKAIRLLNSLLVDCMEIKFIYIKESCMFCDDKFSDKLIEISKSASLPDEDRITLELYISVRYGEPGKNRMVPFKLAKRQGILTEEVKRIEKEIDSEYEEKKASLIKRAWKIYDDTIDKELKSNEAIKKSSYELEDYLLNGRQRILNI